MSTRRSPSTLGDLVRFGPIRPDSCGADPAGTPPAPGLDTGMDTPTPDTTPERTSP